MAITEPRTEQTQAAVVRLREGVPGFDVLRTGVLLRRYLFVHLGFVRALAGWLIATPRYEDKYVFGYHLWDHARHGLALSNRLKDLRGGLAEPSIDPDLRRVVEELVHARDTSEFIAGAYLELVASLATAYHTHLKLADPSANAPEIQLIRVIAVDLEAHLKWANERLSGVPRKCTARWRRYIRKLISAAGDVSDGHRTNGLEASPRPHDCQFARPKTVVMDARFQRGGLLSLEKRSKLEYEAELVEQFKVFFNEIYAACILASVLYDSFGSGMPVEFMNDVAHQCWDEIRHSEFGRQRLEDLGLRPQNYDPILYEEIEGLPLLHRYCHLTLSLEPYFMARKRPRLEQYRRRGDARSSLYADIDWSDEINHVRYGKRWIEWFLRNDARTIADIQSEVRVRLSRHATSTGDGPTEFSPF